MPQPKVVKVLILRACVAAGNIVKPGQIVELPEEDASILLGYNKATKDLKFELPKPAVKKEEKKEEKKDPK